MKLTLHEDGFGYDEGGRRYWRDPSGHWLRAHLSPGPVSVAGPPTVGRKSGGRVRVAYRCEGDNHVTIYETT